MIKKMFTFVLVFSMMLYFAQFLGNAKSNQSQKHQGYQFEFLENVPQPKIIDPEKIKERHEWIQQQIAHIWEKTHNPKAVDAFFNEKNGFINVPVKQPMNSSQDISIQSDGSTQVTMYTPTISYDSYTGEYIFQGKMKWKTGTDSCSTPYWYNDITSEGNVGGYDEMGIWLNTSSNMMLTDHFLQTFYRYPTRPGHGSTTVTQPKDWFSGGVVFQNQDKSQYDFVDYTCTSKNWDYSWDSTVITMYIKLTGSKSGTFELHSQVGHSWSSTTINSLGISTSGVSVGWSSSSNKWEIESPAKYWTP